MQVITLDANGITKLSYSDIKQELQTRLLSAVPSLIFRGTPAGTIVDICTDVIDNIANNTISIYQQFQLAYSEGTMLDTIGQIQGNPRAIGSKTIQGITVTTNKITTLVGGSFKVKDAGQNIYILQTTQTNLPIGTHLLTFVAENQGAIQSGLNTINIIDTPQVGVVSVNNTVAPTFIGENFESDTRYRLRLQKSYQINALGYLGSLIAQLQAVNGVILANAIQNSTDIVDSYGIPARHVACVVEGGNDLIIAEVISKNTCLPSFGDISSTIILPNGLSQVYYFSRPINIPLYIKIDIQNTGNYSNFDFIKTAIVNEVGFNILQNASSDRIIQIVKNIPNTNIVIFNAQLSLDDITYQELIVTNSYKTRYIFDFAKIQFIII